LIERVIGLASRGWLWLDILLDHQIVWPKPMANHGWPEGWTIGLPRPKQLANHGWPLLGNHCQPEACAMTLDRPKPFANHGWPPTNHSVHYMMRACQIREATQYKFSDA